MSDTPNTPDRRPGIGDNAPPEPTPLERAAELIPACDEWTKGGPLTSADQAAVLSEFGVQVRQGRAAAVAARDAERKPHEDALAEINGRYAPTLAKLDIAVERIFGSKKVTGLLPDWMVRQKQQLAEEAERKKREAAEAAQLAERAADRAAIDGTIDAELQARQAVETAEELRQDAERKPERVRVKGDLAPKAIGLVPRWSARIVDWKLAGQHYKREPKVIAAFRAAIESLANADARRLKDKAQAPPGVEFEMRETAQ